MRKHCWQNYPSSQPQKLKTLPAKDRHGRNVHTIYIILVFSFRAEAKLQKKKKNSFSGGGDGHQVRAKEWCRSTQSTAQGKVKGKRTTAGTTSRRGRSTIRSGRLQHAAIQSLSLSVSLLVHIYIIT